MRRRTAGRTRARAIGLAGALALVAFAGSAAPDRDAPKDVGLKESVQVSLIGLEVTVWPKTQDSDACLGLTIDDFDLRVDNEPQKIYAVDALGSTQETHGQGSHDAEASPPVG